MTTGQVVRPTNENPAKRTAVVTGAGSGIGRAIASRLLADGIAVVAVDRDKHTLATLDGTRQIECDLGNDAQRLALVQELGPVDYLVNAAGITRLSPIDEVAAEDWDSIMDVNAKAVFFLTQTLAKQLKPGSSIVNIASIAGKHASTVESAVYNVSKAAVIAMTKTFAYAYAERGIRVNCVCPGFTVTPMAETVLHNVAEARAMTPDEVMEGLYQAIPLRRMGQPDEIANAVTFLLSDEASYITAQAVNVSGGWVTY